MEDYKNLIIPIIKWLSIDFYEILIDIKVSNDIYHSIEWFQEENKIILHKFKNNNLDIEYDFEKFDIQTKKEIYYFLLKYLN